MTNDTIKHKVKVFISSKCDGRYEIARKALEKLLHETGMVECFCFETEAASSIPMPSVYLDAIPLYQLLLLIVDNEDNISDATMAEYKKAKENDLHIIAIFCNENKKEQTEIEKEIISEGLCKFTTVSRFSDIVEIAYKSVIQDILSTYMLKPKLPETISVINEVKEVISEVKEVPNAINCQVNKSFFNEFDATKHAILDSLYKSKPAETNPSETDALFQQFLQVILCNTPFDDELFNKLKTVVLEKHSEQIIDIIARRLDAIKCYFKGDISNCVTKLDDLTEKLKTMPNIPKWICNDVALDLRNMISLQAAAQDIITINNKGQQALDDNSEYLYFPAIDRIANNIQKNVIKEYSKINLQSPYSTTLGGLDFIFADISSYYCVALLYGSITHLRLTRLYMAEILEVLSQEYSNQEFHSELLRYLMLLSDEKRIKNISRTYNRSYDIVSSVELQKIIDSISYLPTEYEKTHSSLLLLEFFGYYLSDEQYETQINWFLDYSKEWAKDKKRNFNFNQNIKNVFQNCCERIPRQHTAEFVINLLNSKNYRLYDIACELIGFIDIKELSQHTQKRLASKLKKLIENKGSRENTYKLRHAITVFALNTSIDLSSFEDSLKANMEAFFYGEYSLDLYVKDKKSSLKQIQTYIEDIESRIATQGKNGCYSGFMGNPFKTIENIITINNLKFTWSEMQPIVVTTSNFVLASNQSCGEKRQALTLLTTLVQLHPRSQKLKKYVCEIIQKRDEILKVISLELFDTTKTSTLLVALDFLSFLVGGSPSTDVVSSLSNIATMDDRDIIACMQYLSHSLDNSNLKSFSSEVLVSVFQLSTSLFYHKECDIRFFSVKCLIALTNSKYQHLALKQLSMCMNSGSSDIRIAIISRIKKIKDDSSTKEHILQKAIIDPHYCVRKIAKETEAI